MYTLGISALYHDSAAAIVKDDNIIAAVQEERYTRKKHDQRLPINSIHYCLNEAGIKSSALDAVIYYENPILALDRVIKSGLMSGEKGKDQLYTTSKSLLSNKLWIADQLRSVIGELGKSDKLLFAEHHMSHAASAFYPSPYNSAAILTTDGVGEWATTTIGYGKGSEIEIVKEISFPHSLGLLYSAFTMYCGFKVNSGEYKLMGLAPYGDPKYYELIKDNLIDIKDDGSFRLNMDYFAYLTEQKMINEKFEELFGEETRKPESKISLMYMDVAASIQKVTEEAVYKLAKHAMDITESENLVLAGGVALNCVANGKLLTHELVDNLWVQPAAGDAGGALGAALLTTHKYFNIPRKPKNKDSQKGSYLGPAFTEEEIRKFLDDNNCYYQHYTDDSVLYENIADELSKGSIVGHFSGRMEFGPRALGGRSILGDSRNSEMQSKMNLKIKYRESFRPFAPSVLAEDAEKYFELKSQSPYMLLVAPVKADRRKKFDISEFRNNKDSLIDMVNSTRSDVPAVTHVDFSARVQTVNQENHPRFYNLIKAFKEKTEYGIVVNTSFNVRGEPIVCTPEDAYTCFMRTEMDILVLENFVLYKKDQKMNNYYDDWEDEYELD